jgi:hypothetical protein
MNATYENLNNSEKLDLLDNQELISKLFLYCRAVDYYNIGNGTQSLNLSRNHISPFINDLEYFIHRQFILYTVQQLLNGTDFFPPLTDNLEKYALRPELGNLLVLKKSTLKNQLRDFKGLLAQAEELTKTIDELE